MRQCLFLRCANWLYQCLREEAVFDAEGEAEGEVEAEGEGKAEA